MEINLWKRVCKVSRATRNSAAAEQAAQNRRMCKEKRDQQLRKIWPATGIKYHQDRLLLNLKHLSFFFLKNFNNELYKVPTGRLHVRGFESCQQQHQQQQQQQLDSVNQPSKGCAHLHDEILLHRSGDEKAHWRISVSENGTFTDVKVIWVDSFTHCCTKTLN